MVETPSTPAAPFSAVPGEIVGEHAGGAIDDG